VTDVSYIRQAGRAASLLKAPRRLLLEQLATPDSAAGLARRLKIPRQRLNYHLRELEKDGLLECVEERRKGNCTERMLKATARAYVITPEALGALGRPADGPIDQFSADYLAAAAGRTIQEIAELESRARAEGRRLATLTIESEIRFASTTSRAAFAEDLADAVARLVAKYHDDAAPAGRRFRLLACVHPSIHRPPSAEPEPEVRA
jgi:DNA-binding transcriptional ArsR family regulator